MKNSLKVLLMVFWAIVLVGCGGGRPYAPLIEVAATSFTMSGSSPQSVQVGQSAVYTISTANSNVQPAKQTRETDTIGFSVESGLPAGATATFDPTSVAVGGTTTLTVHTAGSTPVGTYTIVVVGTRGSTVQRVNLSLLVSQTFALSASGAQSVDAGNSASFTISENFGAQQRPARSSTPITLSVAGLPTGTTATFTPGSINQGGSSQLTLHTSSNTPPGAYTFTVTGDRDGELRTTTVSLNVSIEFNVNGSAAQTVTAGSPGSFSFTPVQVVASSRGDRDVTMAVVSGVPAGATASFATTTTPLGTADVLTVNTSGETPPGTYTITVSGTLGGRTRTATGTLTVLAPPDFSLSSEGFVNVGLGSPGSVVVNVNSSSPAKGRGANDVTLSVTNGMPVGMSASFAPTTTTIGSTSTVTFSINGSTPIGEYGVTVSGTNGFFTHTTTIFVDVVPAG